MDEREPRDHGVARRQEGASRTDARAGEVELDRAMERYSVGDATAFGVLHAGLAPRISRYIARLCGSLPLADDLCQETFLRIHRARGSFQPGEAVVPWAYAVARNVFVDHARVAKNRPLPSLDASREDEPSAGEKLVGHEADGEAVAIARQAGMTVQKVLESLPLAQREAFVLLRYEGMSVAEAAAVVGATETAVKLRAFRAYEALRAALGVSS